MATILLQAAGSFVGGFLGPAGSAIGAALGSYGGYLVDQSFFGSRGSSSVSDGLGMKLFSAEEGVPLPRVYGVARISGFVFWMTYPEAKCYQKRQGGKGGSRNSTEERYYEVNIAFALCEGEIAGVRRIWADGREMDLQGSTIRVYTGSNDQKPDPLIETIQGKFKAPAYRGVAYVVFERLNLTPYGNRIPQIQFEVLRPVGSLCQDIKAVALIPGSTEYGLSTHLVRSSLRPGQEIALNRHVLFAPTDLDASLDELRKLCPSLKNVALVVTWYGNDLRAGFCTIRPAVTDIGATGFSDEWSVAGLSRPLAPQISRHKDNSAFGGSPSDKSIIEAIRAIKDRGFNVTVYPFIMMDIPEDNKLKDPYGKQAQSQYPWRGRITCYPGRGMKNSADKTAEARQQIMHFCGSRENSSEYKGSHFISEEWGYRRFIMHLADLVKQAGGVDSFLIGSELCGLTTLRDEKGQFPFVEELCKLASQVRSILGEKTKISYGADWSEYFGYQPSDGSGDVLFHLDPLWSHPEIDSIGIDNYMALSDWRDSDYTRTGPDGFKGPYDKAGLRKMVDGGEGFDWFYASHKARQTQNRTSISDGAYGKPWVYRYKDLVSWWSNFHYDRINGVEKSLPTDWIPESKPIWFTEIGCPAIDKGPNQPGVFVDSKSSESALPYFSSGGRSDLAARRFLNTHLTYWNPSSSDFVPEKNPISKIYKRHMVDHERIYLWAWDARPFPAFPAYSTVWADSDNWRLGHWLNGRLHTLEAADLINAILKDHRLPEAETSSVSGTLSGYFVAEPSTARQALQPLIDLLGLQSRETPDGLFFSDREVLRELSKIEELAVEENTPMIEVTRMPDHDIPAVSILSFRDPMRDFQVSSIRMKKFGAPGTRQSKMVFPGVLEKEEAENFLKGWLRRLWTKRETVIFSVPARTPGVFPGSLVSLKHFGCDGDLLVEQVEEGILCRVVASKIFHRPSAGSRTVSSEIERLPELAIGPALIHFLDLPFMPGQVHTIDQFCIAAWKKPWREQMVYVSPEKTGFRQRTTIRDPASLGILEEEVIPGFAFGRIDHSSTLRVRLFDAEAVSVSMLQILNGANAAAVLSSNGQWEIIQFRLAEEIARGQWILKDLLRGQLGTEDAMHAGAPKGAPFIFLNEAVIPAGLRAGEEGLLLNWRIIDQGNDLSGVSGQNSISVRADSRALKPLAPVHLRCFKSSGEAYHFTWIRRSRIDADHWEGSDIPLGEEDEEYGLEIINLDEYKSYNVSVFAREWLFSKDNFLKVFNKIPSRIQLSVVQKGQGGIFGFPAKREFSLI